MAILPIAAATFVGMVLGAIWYSPLAFGNSWMQCIGKTKDNLGSQTPALIGSVFANLLMAGTVAILLPWAPVDSVIEAALFGLLLGAGIIFPAFLSDNLFCGWGLKLLWIQTGYRITTLVLMSVVIFIFH